MGRSVQATVAFGYDLGSSDSGWKFKEWDEDQYRIIPWSTEDEPDIDDFRDELEKRLLEHTGGASIGDFWGVEADYSGSLYSDTEGYLLVARGSVQTSYWSEVLQLEPAEMILEAERGDYVRKLKAALAAVGLTPTQGEPKWLQYALEG